MLRIIRFLNAFRSPGAGGRPVFTTVFFLSFKVLAAVAGFLLLFAVMVAFVFLGAGPPLTARGEDVENGRAKAGSLDGTWLTWKWDCDAEGLNRHFQQLDEAIAGVSI